MGLQNDTDLFHSSLGISRSLNSLCQIRKAIYNKQKYLRIQGTYPEVSRKMTLPIRNLNIEKFLSNLVNPTTYRPTIHASQIEGFISPNVTNFLLEYNNNFKLNHLCFP